jgi:hypothetical protein
MGEHLPMPLGRFITANLTPAGQLSRWSDGEIFRAIRNGIDADGHWLVIMSLTNAGRLSDAVSGRRPLPNGDSRGLGDSSDIRLR